MARLSGVRAPATPVQRSEEVDDGSVNSEEGSSPDSGRKSNTSRPTTRHSNDATSDNGIMGQGESREDRQQRNATIRAASQLATQPNHKKRGSLPSYSHHRPPHTVSGQRRLQPNPLSGPDVFDLLSEEDLSARQTRTANPKRVANPQQFSPLKRHVRQSSRTLEEAAREHQRLVDAQLGQYEPPEEDVDVAEEDVAEEDDNEDGAEVRSPRRSRRSRKSGESTQEEEDDEGQDEASVNQATSGAEQELFVQQDEPGDNQVQQNTVGKKKRGRPTKASLKSTAETDSATADPQHATGEKRKRGRPATSDALQSNAQAAQSGSAQTSAEPEKTDPQRRSARVSQQTSGDPQLNRAELETAPPPQKRQKQSSVRSQAALRSPPKAPVRDPEPQTTANPEPQQQDIERAGGQSQSPDPAVRNEDGGNPDPQPDHRAEDEEDHDEEDGESEEGSDEPVDDADHRRLYGHWSKLCEILSVAKIHRGAKVRIKDDGFKRLLADCKRVTDTIRVIASDATPDELESSVNRCRSILNRTRKFCGNGDNAANAVDFGDKKLGFHIFKHLIPALLRLLYAIIRAYERLDVETAGNQQLTFEHLNAVVEIMSAIERSEFSAFEGFQGLSEKVRKQNMHTGIGIPLRELADSLSVLRESYLREQRVRAEREEFALQVAALNEQRERRERRRRFSDANHSHWNHLNLIRIGVANTFKWQKLQHLRSCPASVVETDMDGHPFLRLEPRQEEPWTMIELDALKEGLKSFADRRPVPPSESKVFEQLINRECRPGGHLTNRNVLEIVLAANQLRDYLIDKRRDAGAPVELWIERIPRWLRPEGGASEEDAIDIGSDA